MDEFYASFDAADVRNEQELNGAEFRDFMDRIKTNSNNRGVAMYDLDEMNEELREMLFDYFVTHSRVVGRSDLQGINLGGFTAGWIELHTDV